MYKKYIFPNSHTSRINTLLVDKRTKGSPFQAIQVATSVCLANDAYGMKGLRTSQTLIAESKTKALDAK